MAQFGRVALATRSAALSGSHIKAPGFAGGYLLKHPRNPPEGTPLRVPPAFRLGATPVSLRGLSSV